MPAQFEIIHPDNTVAFVDAMRAGEPLYIARDAVGVIELTSSSAGELFAMLLQGESGVVEVTAWQEGRVWLEDALLHGTQPLPPFARLTVDAHVFVLLPDEAAQEKVSGDEAGVSLSDTVAPQVFVDDVQVFQNNDGRNVCAVTVRTARPEESEEPKVKLTLEVGSRTKPFVPLTEAQRKLVTPPPEWEKVLNMKRVDERQFEFFVELVPSDKLLAGDYCLRIHAKITNAPGMRSDFRDVDLKVPPFKQFHMGDPSPARHSWPHFPRTAPKVSTVAVTNTGNTLADFTVQVDNAPNSDCRTEITLQPRKQNASSQAPDTSALESALQPQLMKGLWILPGETRQVQLKLTPQSQPIAGLRHPRHQVNVSVWVEGVAAITKAIRLSTVPLVLGPLGVLLGLLAFAVFTALNVSAMNAHTGFGMQAGTIVSECPTAPALQTISAGQPITLTVCGVPFTDMVMEKLAFNATPAVFAITEISKPISFIADRSVSYRLTATHPLGRLLPWPPFVAHRPIDFALGERNVPTGTWKVDPLTVTVRGDVTVFWDNVDQAKRLTLYVNGAPSVIPIAEIAAGQMKFNVAQPTTFTLEAVSDTGLKVLLGITQTVNINVPPITPTPLPLPVITRFDISPAEVISGQKVLVEWDVAGPPDALTVTLVTNGVPAVVPARGALYQSPQSDESGFRAYELIASNGKDFVAMAKHVQVTVPTPAPTPTPGPVGRPNYDLFCGGEGLSDLRQLGEIWTWVCRANPLADIANAACQRMYGDTAYAKAEDVGKKETWMCWR